MQMRVIDDFHGEYHFLSNFYVHPLQYNGMTWKTSEHAFQAAKTADPAEMMAIKMAPTPGRAKKLGGKEYCRKREDWEEIKVGVMRDIVRAKFSDQTLAIQLLATGDAELIEGNTWFDRTWGCTKDEDGNWVGDNHLGKILMEVREELAKKRESEMHLAHEMPAAELAKILLSLPEGCTVEPNDVRNLLVIDNGNQIIGYIDMNCRQFENYRKEQEVHT